MTLQSSFHNTASSCPLQYMLIAMWKADCLFTKFDTKLATPTSDHHVSVTWHLTNTHLSYMVQLDKRFMSACVLFVMLLTRSREVLGSALGLGTGCPEGSYVFLSPSRQMSRQCLVRAATASFQFLSNSSSYASLLPVSLLTS